MGHAAPGDHPFTRRDGDLVCPVLSGDGSRRERVRNGPRPVAGAVGHRRLARSAAGRTA